MEQELLTILDSDENKKYYRYLLIDALTTVSEMDFIALNNLQDMLGENAVTTVPRSDLIHDLDSCPKLITLGEPGKALEKRLLHFSVIEAEDEVLQKKRYVSSWMVSEHPPEIIAKQIANIGDFFGQFLKTKFIPFYEPFKMQLLHEGNAICPEFLADLLTPFLTYCYPTIKNNIGVISCLHYKPESIDTFISEDAKFYQKESNTIFELYLTQCDIYHKIGKNKFDINLMEIAQTYQQSCIIGLPRIADRFVFASMTLRYGNLMSNPIIKATVEKAKCGQSTLIELFNNIDKKEFMTILNSRPNEI